MASQALYRKWRSQTFNEVIGQDHVTETLINALQLERIGHAYLFTGPRGTGKTSTARLLAKAVNCTSEDTLARPCNQCSICRAITEGRLLDLIEIDAASNTGVDDIRDLRDKVSFRPSEARIKFYIIDEVHMLSNSAFNALLKTLEEPPAHVIFVLATTEPEKIPATITSRCQRFDFKRISVEQVADRLAFILQQEGLQAERSALEFIARQGGGSMRDAISLLDQLAAYGQNEITLDRVKTVLGVVASQTVIELVDALIQQDIATGLQIINQVVNDGGDPRQFGREIVEYLRKVMLTKHVGQAGIIDLSDDVAQAVLRQSKQADERQLWQATKLFNQSLLDLKSGLLTIPHLSLELVFVEVATNSVVHSPHVETQRASPSTIKPSHSPPAAIQSAKTASDLNLEQVQQSFGRVAQVIEYKNKLMAEVLRNNAQIYQVEGSKICLAVDKTWKARFEQPLPKTALIEAFVQVIGQSIELELVSKEAITNQQEGTNPEALVAMARKLANSNSV